MENKNMNFEDSIKELEKISEKLESGEVSLEESIELYEKGIALSKYCSDLLLKAKQKIITIEQANEEK